MTESTNLIIARMKQPHYNYNWIYAKPPILPYSAAYTDWREILSGIAEYTINTTITTTTSPYLHLTSDLQSSEMDIQ